jgi:uncharacterized membrane protein
MDIKDNQPAKRIKFLDVTRGLAIFFMIMQHAMIIFEQNSGEDSILGMTILLSGTAPAAPLFLLIMGIFLGRLKSVNLRQGIVRGIKLLALGYGLNVIRFVLPLMLVEDHGILLDNNESAISLFFVFDILQLAGVCLILLSILKKYVPWAVTWPVLAGGIAIISPLVWNTGEHVFFPLFPWIVYPLVGMFYGRFLIGCKDMRILMKNTSGTGLLLMIVGGLTFLLPENNIFVVGDYFRSGPGIHLLILGFVFIWLSLFWLLTERLSENSVLRILCFWSKNVTVIYIVQWVLIGWSGLLLGYNKQTAVHAVLIGFIIVLMSHFLARFIIERMIHKSK